MFMRGLFQIGMTRKKKSPLFVMKNGDCFIWDY